MNTGEILVVGAGISGLTAAAGLARSGFTVDLVEQKDEVGDGGGVGLTLVANAMRALDSLGVAEACVEAGMPSDSLAMCRPDGVVVAETPSPRIGGPKWPGSTGISRSALHGILVGAAEEAGVRTRCATTVTDWRQDEAGLYVDFSDGRSGRYMLMVAADGLYSKTRQRLMPDCRPEMTGQAVWRADTPRPSGITRTHLHIGGPQGAVGICPVAQDRSYLYIVEAAPENLRRDPETLHLQMQEALAGYGGLVRELAATLDRPEKVNYRPLEWLLAPSPWGEGRIVMIGDAVHANPPVLAQGAAMGIEDAVVLAEELAGAPDVAQALAGTLARRYDRVRGVVERSCQLARWEVEHTPGVDMAAVMLANSKALASPM